MNRTLAERWQVVMVALTSAASNVLGFSSHHQPNWFVDSLGFLQQFAYP